MKQPEDYENRLTDEQRQELDYALVLLREKRADFNTMMCNLHAIDTTKFRHVKTDRVRMGHADVLDEFEV